ncbi:MAG: flagellar motor switch protein FliG [Actinobacteria bacterium]|nr:flagellar motor switch protein FliG [Actinomycetota bacterium]
MVKSDNREKGLKKVAVLLISMGTETAAKIMSHLHADQVEELALEIANLKDIETSKKEAVLQEFYEDFITRDNLDRGGMNYAQSILKEAFGENKALELSKKVADRISIKPFHFLRGTEPEQLLNIIKNEHPQTIALVLSYLPYEQGSKILCSLKPEQQAEVGIRIATMDRTTPEVIAKVESILSRKISSFAGQDLRSVSGIKKIVGILNQVDRGTEKSILKSFEKKDKKLAEEVRSLMFVFEDILKLDDRAIQRILKDIDSNILGRALKGSSREVKDKIFKNMSERASLIIQEDMEAMGPIRITEVETSQQTIVRKIKELDDSGEIILARGGAEVLV